MRSFLATSVTNQKGGLELGESRAPPAGLEPAPPAPEAGALSAELRGRVRCKAGDDRTRHAATAPLRPQGRANAAVSCISMPTDHDVATAPLERHLLPRSARSTRRDICGSADIDLLDLAAEFGTPLFVYDEEHLRHACREAVAAWGDGVAYATKAFLCRAMARLAHDEGMHLDVASGGELHVALSAGVPGRTAGPARQQQVGRRAGRRARARRGPDRDRLVRRDRPPGRACSSRRRPEPTRPKVLVRVTPGVEAHTHEFVRTGQEDSKFGFSVSSGAAAEAVAALELMPGVELVGHPRAHRQPGLRRLVVRAGRRGAGLPSSPRSGCPSSWWAAVWACPYVNGESAPTQADWAEATRAACARAGVDPGHADLGRARALHRRHRRHDPLHRGDGEAPPGHPHLRQRRRRHERQPASGPLRQWLRGLPPPCRRRRHAAGRCASSASTARAAISSCPRPSFPTTSRWATSWPPRSPAPTGIHGLQLQQGAPPGGRLRG